MNNPIYLIVQGTLHENSEETYANYARVVLPLMKEFGVETVAIGGGFESGRPLLRRCTKPSQSLHLRIPS